MEIYLAVWFSNDDHEVIGAYSDEAKAEEVAERHYETMPYKYGRWDVEVYELDKDPTQKSFETS